MPSASAAAASRWIAPVAAFLAPLGLASLVAPWLPQHPVAALGCAYLAAAAIAAGVGLAPVDVPLGVRGALVRAVGGAALVALSLALPPVLSGLAGSLGLLAVALAVGGVVGSRMALAGHLLPVAMVSAAVDLWSVSSPSGPTHAIVRNPALLRLLTVSVALPGDRTPWPVVGFGDVAFAALYLAAARRFALPAGRMGAAVLVGLWASLGLALATGGAVPALPAMGAAVVLSFAAARRVAPVDRAATGVAAALLAASVARAAWR